jgi:hypothetical protein
MEKLKTLATISQELITEVNKDIKSKPSVIMDNIMRDNIHDIEELITHNTDGIQLPSGITFEPKTDNEKIVIAMITERLDYFVSIIAVAIGTYAQEMIDANPLKSVTASADAHVVASKTICQKLYNYTQNQYVKLIDANYQIIRQLSTNRIQFKLSLNFTIDGKSYIKEIMLTIME